MPTKQQLIVEVALPALGQVRDRKGYLKMHEQATQLKLGKKLLELIASGKIIRDLRYKKLRYTRHSEQFLKYSLTFTCE